MTESEFDIFLHRQGEQPTVVAAKETETLDEFLRRNGVPLGKGEARLHVFVGESGLTGSDEDDDADDEREVKKTTATLAELDARGKRHIHCHRCRRIAVEVNFGGHTKSRKFPPAATVETVAGWARRVFRLDPAAASEYVLQICGSVDQPRPDTHIGDVPGAADCALCFDLVKEITPQG